jgi:hypothetical protein
MPDCLRSFVYCLVNRHNGKRYVGKANDPEFRFKPPDRTVQIDLASNVPSHGASSSPQSSTLSTFASASVDARNAGPIRSARASWQTMSADGLKVPRRTWHLAPGGSNGSVGGGQGRLGQTEIG